MFKQILEQLNKNFTDNSIKFKTGHCKLRKDIILQQLKKQLEKTQFAPSNQKRRTQSKAWGQIAKEEAKRNNNRRKASSTKLTTHTQQRKEAQLARYGVPEQESTDN